MGVAVERRSARVRGDVIVPLRRLFAVSSVLFLVVLVISPVKNALRPYRSIQAGFRDFGAAHATTTKAARAYAGRPIAVQQIWLPEFDNRVDRCTTCHLGVADPVMRGAPEPYRQHPLTYHTPRDFGRFGCTVCHRGQGLSTTNANAHEGAEGSGPGPVLPAMYIEAGCGLCHADESVPEAAKLSHGRTLMASAGCYACHAVRGHEDFRSDAPPLNTVAVKTGGELLHRWLANPKAVDPNATMPNFRLTADEIRDLSHYLCSRPVPDGLRAAVDRAEAEPAGDAAHGKVLFAESRCISCHTVEGKGNGSGPELNTVASRATKGWLIAFVRDPHAFNPQTRMPQYAFSDQDVRDIVAWFENELRDFDAPPNILEPLRVNQTMAGRGAQTFRNRGCFACHEAQKGERFGPDLDGIGDRKAASLDFGKRGDLPRTIASWLGEKIKSPSSFASGLKMPTYGFKEADREAIVTALLALGEPPASNPYRFAAAQQQAVIPAGRVGRIVDRYRCLSCHQFGSRGGDISNAPLTFEGSKANKDWIVKYLAVPYSMRPLLAERMPVFKIPPNDAQELAAAFDSFYVDPQIADDPFAGRPAADADVAEGARLYTTLGCRACHTIGSTGGYYGAPLTDTKSRLKPGWLYAFMRNPQRWRADTRCPNYGLTETDALRITAYLETLSSESPQSKPGGSPVAKKAGR